MLDTADGFAREDGVTLHEIIVIDGYGSDEKRAAARLLDTDTRWQDVSDADTQNTPFSSSFFDPKGFFYYLPTQSYATLSYLYDEAGQSRLQFPQVRNKA